MRYHAATHLLPPLLLLRLKAGEAPPPHSLQLERSLQGSIHLGLLAALQQQKLVLLLSLSPHELPHLQLMLPSLPPHALPLLLLLVLLLGVLEHLCPPCFSHLLRKRQALACC